MIEIFRGTKADGSIQPKGRVEKTIEGVLLMVLVLAWIPAVMLATTPGGPASLIGNAYFFTWLTVILIFEAMFWFIHDVRQDLFKALQEKEEEYRQQQQKVLDHTNKIRDRAATREMPLPQEEQVDNDYFDAMDAF